MRQKYTLQPGICWFCPARTFFPFPCPLCTDALPGLLFSKVPVWTRFRSDKYAAVLRLQNTQPKDRRIYTVLTGILAEQQPWQSIGTQRAGEGRESPGGPEPTYAGLQSIFFRGSV